MSRHRWNAFAESDPEHVDVTVRAAHPALLLAAGFAAGACCVYGYKFLCESGWFKCSAACGEGYDRYGQSQATPDLNVVDESLEESFPCSDPPAFNTSRRA